MVIGSSGVLLKSVLPDSTTLLLEDEDGEAEDDCPVATAWDDLFELENHQPEEEDEDGHQP